MQTVDSIELEQKTSEYIYYIKNYLKTHRGELKLYSPRDSFLLSNEDNEVVLKFPTGEE